MPYKSKAQYRKFFAMAGRGEISMGKAKEWAHKTPSIKALPERVKKKKKKPRDKYAKLLRRKKGEFTIH